ncbi:MAG: T9SS type A sorting domain-containing protein [Bacteroidales bacterium]|nr:T9SS type A sorting domain-containing protein [Bacteroidales bacterium]
MKKHLFLLLFLPIISWQSLWSQSSYTLTIERAGESVSPCAIATENNEVIAVLDRLGLEDGIAELIRIDANGNITDSLLFSSVPNRFNRIIQIGQSIHENTYLGLGVQWTGIETSKYLWIFEFDDNFNVQWEQIIDTINYEPTFMQFQHWSNHYFIGTYIYETSQTFSYKVTDYGELMKRVSIPLPEEPNPAPWNPVFYIRQIPETSHFLMNRSTFDRQTAVMDDDLNYLYSIYPTIYPNQNPDMRFPLDLEFFNNTEFIRSGRIEKNKSDYRDLLAVKKMDTASRNEAKVRKFGYEGFEEGRGCYSGAFKALAMHPDYFFVGGFAFSSSDAYSNYDNFIMAYAFDYDLDSLWATNIGNDAYYELFYVSPTPDGGCVLAASRYDWRKGEKKRNTFIAKLSKPDFTSISEPEKSKPLVTIFPNPGNNQFLIQTELVNFTLQLYDLQGKLLLTQQNGKEVNTEKLPSGCYLYRVIADNGEAMHGKWVKR